MNTLDSSNSRRDFLMKTSAAAAAIPLITAPNLLAAGPKNDNAIKVGLIGCGGRGTGATFNALMADKNVILWSMGDAFKSKLDGSLRNLSKNGRVSKQVKVASERQFVGMDAYQQVLESGVDVVLITAPPGFRPQHLRAAVEAGKHVFAEKPMAVDMPGVRSVMESAEIAKKKNVSIQHGFCWRYDPGLRDSYGRVLNGDFGKVRSIYGTYMGHVHKPLKVGQTKPKGMSDVEWQVRWWANFEWLSGAPILEQSIHAVDKIAWAMGDVLPVAAVGTGGRAVRKDPSNIYDHYNVAYEYPGGVTCHLGARQFNNCHSEVIDRVVCEEGTLVGPQNPRVVGLDGKTSWRHKGKAGEELNMYQVCHNEFFASIRKGEVVNTGKYMAQSTALGILGRDAAHTGKRIKWKNLMKSEKDLAPDSLKFGDAFPIAPAPIPGQ